MAFVHVCVCETATAAETSGWARMRWALALAESGRVAGEHGGFDGGVALGVCLDEAVVAGFHDVRC